MKKKKKTIGHSWGVAVFLLFLVSLIVALTSVYVADCLFERALNQACMDYVPIQKQKGSGTEQGYKDEIGMEQGEQNRMKEGQNGIREENQNGMKEEEQSEIRTEQEDQNQIGMKLEYNDGIYRKDVRYASEKDMSGNCAEEL